MENEEENINEENPEYEVTVERESDVLDIVETVVDAVYWLATSDYESDAKTAMMNDFAITIKLCNKVLRKSLQKELDKP